MKTYTLYPFTQTLIRSILALLFVSTVVQCKKDSPEEIHDEETINRVTLTVTDANGTSTDYTWNEGDNEPNINLSANSTHQVSIAFYDASDAADVEDITEEVIEEADEHFVFYQVNSASLTIAAASNDVTDSDGVAIHVKTQWTTTDASSGVVMVYLVHEPTSKTGTTRSALGGSTDVELSFPVEIQ